MTVVQGNRGCNRIRPLLDSYLSNELLVETNAEIQRHLGECELCFRFLSGRAETRDLLRRAAGQVSAPAGMEGRVRQAIRCQAGTGPKLIRANWLPLAAVAAGLMIVAVTAAGRHGGDAALHPGWANHMQCTLAGHFPDQLPSDEAMADRLGSQYAGMLDVVRRQMDGYRVRQGHQCTTAGRKFAHVILQRGTVLLSVSVVERPGAESLPRRKGMRTTVLQGVEVAGFEAGNYVVFVSSNQGRADNVKVAAMLAPGMRETLTASTNG